MCKSQIFFTYRATFQFGGTVKEQLEALIAYQQGKTSTEPETQAYYHHLQVISPKVRLYLSIRTWPVNKHCIWTRWLTRPTLIAGFCSMKWIGLFLLPPGWDASSSQGYPQHYICQYPFIRLRGERHCESKVSYTTQCPWPGLKPRPLIPESSTLTMRLLCHPWFLSLSNTMALGVEGDGEELSNLVSLIQRPTFLCHYIY